MKSQEIIERLDLAINNIQKNDLVTDFPTVIDDLYFIYINLDKYMSTLSPGEEFMYSTKVEEKLIEYFKILTTKYIKLKHKIDLKFEINQGYDMTSISSGAYDSKEDTIKYATFGLMMNRTNKSSYLETFLHESRHKMQNELYRTSDIARVIITMPNSIILAKEYAYAKGKDVDSKFYMENYNSLYTEMDAEVYSLKELRKMFSTLYSEYINIAKQNNIPVSEETTTKLDLVTKEINMHVNDIQLSLMKCGRMPQKIMAEGYGMSQISTQYVEEGQKVDKLIALDKYIKAHPEIQEVMPIFKLIFNGNVPKTYEEIISDKERMKQYLPQHKNEIDAVYKNIIQSDPMLYLTHLLECNKTYLVTRFFNDHPIIHEEYSEEIRIIAEKYNSLEHLLLFNPENDKKKK